MLSQITIRRSIRDFLFSWVSKIINKSIEIDYAYKEKYQQA